MKKLFYTCITFSLLFLSACDKDQALTNKMDGEWEIQQIIFSANGQDSIATAPIGVFYFEACKLGNGNCSGYYELNGYDRVEIGYNAEAKPQEVHMSTLSAAKVIFRGTYLIDDFSSDRLSLSGDASTSFKEGEVQKHYEVKIDLKRK